MSGRKATLSLVTIALLCLPGKGPQGSESSPPARLLLVTGQDVPAHDWKDTTAVTRQILEDAGFTVVVCEDAGILESSVLHSYDAVVLNYRNKPHTKLSEAGQQQLLRFLAAGKGLVALHFAVNAWRDWKDCSRILGRVWVGKRHGGTSRHGKRGVFRVVPSPGNALTEGLDAFEADDELYMGLMGDTPIQVLATARSETTGKDEPMAWTLEPEGGRVFVLTLGHDARSRNVAGFQELLRRGCHWASRKASD